MNANKNGNGNPYKDIWIPVEVGKGMFDTESAVVIKMASGKIVSMFVDNSLLRNERGNWELKVTFIKKTGSNTRVLLPQEAFETGSVWADVPCQ